MDQGQYAVSERDHAPIPSSYSHVKPSHLHSPPPLRNNTGSDYDNYDNYNNQPYGQHPSYTINAHSTQPEQQAFLESSQQYPGRNSNIINSSNGPRGVAKDYDLPFPLQEETGHEPDMIAISLSSPLAALRLQFLTTLSTIVFTVLPVVITAGGDATWGHWYGWRDACRLIEPFCSGLLHSWFFYSSDLMRRWPSSTSTSSSSSPSSRKTDKRRWDSGAVLMNEEPEGESFKDSYRFKACLSTAFTFFLILYVVGAGIHAAAAFFKNTISLFLEAHSQGVGLSTHPLTDGDGQLSLELAQELKQGYLLIQDVWEHSVSHYMYAFGALGMSWCEMAAYSGQVLPPGVNLARMGKVTMGSKYKGSSKWPVAFWVLVGVLYGGIVAGVACQYPKGLYVGSVYVILLLLVLCTYILTRPTRGLFTLGRYYIIQTYIIGGVVAAVAIVIYMAIHHFDMLTSNDKSHLDSINRP